MPSSHPETWFQRNLKWLIPLIVVGGLVILGVSVAVIAFGVLELLKRSEPYQMALRQLDSSVEAREALGPPIWPGWWVSGNIEATGSSGTADLAIPVSVSSASGVLYLKAVKELGEWRIEALVLEIDGSEERIPIVGDIARAPPPVALWDNEFLAWTNS